VPDEKQPIAPAQSEQTPAEPSEQSVDSPAEQAAMPAAIQAEAAATPGQCVRFCVSNADVEGSGYTDKDISFRVRVFVPDNLQLNSGGQQITPGKLNLGLCIGYDGALYTAPIKGTPTFLSTLTYRCIKNGTPYWVYTFCVAGREQHFTLQGGQVSDLYVKITLDDPSIDATSFVLQVDEVRLNK
jgi:hypothetical protein